MTGKLIICPTPIGNLGDVSGRMRAALATADGICAEDTRVTRKLLSALDVAAPPVERLDENVMGERTEALLQRVAAGETLVYVSDAGMPGVSDPGLRLVQAARDAGVPVEVLPGPSATITAYVASGTVCPQFYFGGFFPRKDAARRQLLGSLAALDAALIFYESPNRLVSALQCIAEELPLRTVSVCRELTKLHEEVVRGVAPDVHSEFFQRESIKGEIALVIDAPSAQEAEGAAADVRQGAQERAKELTEEGLRPKEISKKLMEELGISRNEAYNLALAARA